MAFSLLWAVGLKNRSIDSQAQPCSFVALLFPVLCLSSRTTACRSHGPMKARFTNALSADRAWSSARVPLPTQDFQAPASLSCLPQPSPPQSLPHPSRNPSVPCTQHLLAAPQRLRFSPPQCLEGRHNAPLPCTASPLLPAPQRVHRNASASHWRWLVI